MIHRYAIADGGAEWEEAELQIRNSQNGSRKSTTVSVKSKDTFKRKAGEAVAEALKEIEAIKPKKQKKGKKSDR
jgi:N-acetyltransferase 10